MEKEKLEKLSEFLEKRIQVPRITRNLKYQSAYMDVNDLGYLTLKHDFNKKIVKKYQLYKCFNFDRDTKLWEVKKIPNIEVCRFLLNINNEFENFYWHLSKKAYLFLRNEYEKFQEDIKSHMDKVKIKRKNDIKDLDDLNLREGINPFPFQRVGIKFIDENDGIAMIGDSMGLGKTMQAIAYTSMKNFLTIVICPASLKYNWKREIDKFTYHEGLVLSELKKPTYKELKDNIPNYVIINYEQLEKYEKILKKIKWDCVVLDESHYISNSKSNRYKKVRSCFKNTPHKILLSGTAIKNRPIEFYTQLNFLKPELFPNKEHFGLRYCDAKLNNWGNKENFKGYIYDGYSNARELNAKISSFYIRRLKENVLKDLPDKTINVLDIELTNEEKQEYLNLCEDFIELLNQNKGEKLPISLKRVVKIKQFLSKMKINLVKNFVDDLLKEDSRKKVIIFSQFKETQKRLFNYYKKQGNAIISQYSSKRRDDEVEEFNNSPEKRVLVASTISGGVGFNITSANTVVFADLMWNYSDHEQAEDRAYRIGQKNAVSIYYLNYLDTIEQLLWKILEKKIDIVGQVLDGKEEKESLSEKEIIKQFLNDFKADIKLKIQKTD